MPTQQPLMRSILLVPALLGGCTSTPPRTTTPIKPPDSPFFTNYPTTKPAEQDGRQPGPIGWSSVEELAKNPPPSEDHYQPFLERLKSHNLIASEARIADIGAGRGTFSMMLARDAAPDGVVYAVELQPALVAYIAGRAAERGFTNIVPVLSSAKSLNLPWPMMGPPTLPGRMDLAVILETYHEFSDPVSMLASIRNILKPRSQTSLGGHVVVIEMRTEAPERTHGPLHTMTREQVIREWEAQGFELIDSDDGIPLYHFLVFAAKL